MAAEIQICVDRMHITRVRVRIHSRACALRRADAQSEFRPPNHLSAGLFGLTKHM